jgi:hypothetical protein
MLTPALLDPSLNLKIWPFSGSLAELCQNSSTVVVETYPTEFYTHLGLSFSSSHHGSKRRRLNRQAYAHHLIFWANLLNIVLDPSIRQMLITGFGDSPYGEDRFDAIVGLYGMINVILGNHPTGEPLYHRITTVEGWIFGQEGSKMGFYDSRSI